MESKILEVHKKYLVEAKFTIGDKVIVQKGLLKGQSVTIRDIEDKEVQVKVNNKIQFIPLKDLL